MIDVSYFRSHAETDNGSQQKVCTVWLQFSDLFSDGFRSSCLAMCVYIYIYINTAAKKKPIIERRLSS